VGDFCPARSIEEQRYQKLMQEHHYLGSLPKISETLWYIAAWRDQWVPLLIFSASALKCAAWDRWIENITRLRRFAIGIIKSKSIGGVAQKKRELTRNARLVFDCLRMTKNSCTAACH
jgi:hypothetical protein